RDVQAIANVAKVDRLRHATVERTPPRLYDGDAGARAPEGDTGGAFLRATASARVFPPRATPDAEVLQGLVFPAGGQLADVEAPETARDGVRALPSAVDVAAWLGANEARTILHESRNDAYAGFDAALTRLSARRPPDEQRHASLYMTALDVLATMLAPS